MFKRNLPDYQSTIQYNRASLRSALKLRIFNIVLATLALSYFVIQFILNTEWDMFLVTIVFVWLLYTLIKGYIQWHNILKTGTRIERGSNETTTKIA